VLIGFVAFALLTVLVTVVSCVQGSNCPDGQHLVRISGTKYRPEQWKCV
jgi:hypothetical protein